MIFARLFKKHWRKFFVLALIPLALVAFANFWITQSASHAIHTQISAVPQNQVGLVLGTGPVTARGNVNLHFTARINAASQLYKSGKVKHLLLSGDNHIRGYDEPTEMKNALLKQGVPDSAMTLDYAGLRTLDSMERAKKIFGQKKLTIITEDFHAARSVFLARHFGIDAVAFCAEKLPSNWTRTLRIREAAARTVAVLDIYVFHRGARHLGEQVPIHVVAR